MNIKTLLSNLCEASVYSPRPMQDYYVHYNTKVNGEPYVFRVSANSQCDNLAVWNLLYLLAPRLRDDVVFLDGDGPSLEKIKALAKLEVEGVPLEELMVGASASAFLDLLSAAASSFANQNDWRRWLARAKKRVRKHEQSTA